MTGKGKLRFDFRMAKARELASTLALWQAVCRQSWAMFNAVFFIWPGDGLTFDYQFLHCCVAANDLCLLQTPPPPLQVPRPAYYFYILIQNTPFITIICILRLPLAPAWAETRDLFIFSTLVFELTDLSTECKDTVACFICKHRLGKTLPPQQVAGCANLPIVLSWVSCGFMLVKSIRWIKTLKECFSTFRPDLLLTT